MATPRKNAKAKVVPPTIEMTIEEAPILPVKKAVPKKKVVVNEKPEQPIAVTKVKEREPAVIPHKHHQPQNEEIIDTSTFEHDYREIMLKYDPTHNISIPVLTDYEIPLIIGKRATQIAYGHTPLIEPRVGMNHIDIAEEELRQKKTPYIIKRQIGTRVEYWKIADLSVNF